MAFNKPNMHRAATFLAGISVQICYMDLSAYSLSTQVTCLTLKCLLLSETFVFIVIVIISGMTGMILFLTIDFKIPLRNHYCSLSFLLNNLERILTSST